MEPLITIIPARRSRWSSHHWWWWGSWKFGVYRHKYRFALIPLRFALDLSFWFLSLCEINPGLTGLLVRNDASVSIFLLLGLPNRLFVRANFLTMVADRMRDKQIDRRAVKFADEQKNRRNWNSDKLTVPWAQAQKRNGRGQMIGATDAGLETGTKKTGRRRNRQVRLIFAFPLATLTLSLAILTFVDVLT